MKYRYGAAILAIRNDFCVEESVKELLRQGVEKVLILCPYTYWSDRTEPPTQYYDELAVIARNTGAALRRAECVLNNRPEIAEKDVAVYTEALYRNLATEILAKAHDIDFVLTVDADELWLPGTLEEIDSLAEPGVTICQPGIPVIGVPGLPIKGAKDTILAASHRTVEFEWGRSTKGPRKNGTIPVIHFSATRRTMFELVQKCKMSAHYADKTYDFDGWIQNVLPNVHVGMKNAHMYKSEDNIWPEVRAWTLEEWATIPASLHPYLLKPETPCPGTAP